MSQAIARASARGEFVLISAIDHDSGLLARELRKALNQLHLVPALHFEYRPADGRLDDVVRESLAARPTTMVVVANAGQSRDMIRLLRQQGFAGPLFAGPSVGQELFLREIGPAGDSVRLPLLVDAIPDRLLSAEQIHPGADADRCFPGTSLRVDADHTARLTYDATRLTILAVRRAGLNRAAIGRALRELAPWEGISGRVTWDGPGSNTRPARMGAIRGGQVVERDDHAD
jgi:ABC-type branched-subunit amino acid transport system substrate-binding protein